MGFTDRVLDEVRGRIDADPVILAAVRERLGVVCHAAEGFPGALRSYRSGSIAQSTVIDPVLDGDGGLVLDRRHYPDLGPDGARVGPNAVVEEVRAFIVPLVTEVFPGAALVVGRRSIAVTFPEGVRGQDAAALQYPSVDLIVALTRRAAPGLWIPNCRTGSWDASDPEGHVTLLREGASMLQRVRRRVIRLMKAWSRHFSVPPMCSFNITALALAAVQPGMNLAGALLATLAHGEISLAAGPTSDPAGVSSEPITCPDLARASQLMGQAAAHLAHALEHDDDEVVVRNSMAAVFGDAVAPVPGSKAAVAASLRGSVVSAADLGIATTPAVMLPRVRSWGGHAAILE